MEPQIPAFIGDDQQKPPGGSLEEPPGYNSQKRKPCFLTVLKAPFRIEEIIDGLWIRLS